VKPIWTQRRYPLTVAGVVGLGPVARALGARLWRRGLDGFEGVAGPGVLAILGDAPPWADGAVFIGREPEAPGVWLPTARTLSVHPALLARRLQQDGHRGPVAVLEQCIIPLGEARSIDPTLFRRWLG